MQTTDDIVLSANEWRVFERELNTPNPERSRRAEAFLSQFDDVVARTCDEGVEFDIPWIDDELVAAATDASAMEKVYGDSVKRTAVVSLHWPLTRTGKGRTANAGIRQFYGVSSRGESAPTNRPCSQIKVIEEYYLLGKEQQASVDQKTLFVA